ncbi:MAG TPA: hypothetical protein QF776_05250 [Acidimicrobiales bacterium]|nr:hypothetical protein [Acidimicrobiales bacterium]
MEQQNTQTPPTGLARITGDLIQHSETWGKIWFGLVFWGCVLFAISQRIWPNANNAVLLIASFAIGLASGFAAHIRGYWL